MIERVLFLGSKKLGLRCLQVLASTSPGVVGAISIDDSQDTRTEFESISQFCQKASIPFHVAKNRAQSEDLVRQFRPQICVVVGWYWLIHKEILEFVPNGFVGVHFSMLPKYRGGSPLVWALINGEKEVGLSIFSFTPDIDAGAIWAQRSINVATDDYVGDVLGRLEEQAVKLLAASWQEMLSGKISPTEQNRANATYCSVRTPDDGEIYWRSPAHQILNFIRAQSTPYPGAYTWYEGEKLTIWRARIDDLVYYGTPGQVAQISSDGVRVICGDDRSLILESVQWRGENLTADRVLRSVKIRLPMTKRSEPARL